MYMMVESKVVDALDVGGHVLAGYCDVMPLPAHEFDALKTCVAGRFAQVMKGCAGTEPGFGPGMGGQRPDGIFGNPNFEQKRTRLRDGGGVLLCFRLQGLALKARHVHVPFSSQVPPQHVALAM